MSAILGLNPFKSGTVEFSASAFNIFADTSDGADNKTMGIGGGGAGTASRGGHIYLAGNEAGSGGSVQIQGGNTASGVINLLLGNASAAINFYNASTALMWSFTNGGALQQNGSNGAEIIMSNGTSGLAEPIATLAAAGSTQADATAITRTINRVTGANGTTGVKVGALANYSVGRTITIMNADTTNALKVYTNAAGETVNGQSGTTAITVAAKATIRLVKFDSSNWYASIGAAPF